MLRIRRLRRESSNRLGERTIVCPLHFCGLEKLLRRPTREVGFESRDTELG